MAFTADNELIIREALMNKIIAAGVANTFPSPLIFADKGDFWSIADPQTTKKDAETKIVSFCSISMLKHEDDIESACEDNPLIRLSYNFYLFREINRKRVDEDPSPDEFRKLLLKSERDFLTDYFAIRGWLEGLQPLTGLPAGYDANTNSVFVGEYIKEDEPCRYIKGVNGFSVDMESTIEVLINL